MQKPFPDLFLNTGAHEGEKLTHTDMHGRSPCQSVKPVVGINSEGPRS